MYNQAHTLYTIYFVAVNLVALIIYGWDKFCAKKRRRRVPEATLLMFAVIGGSIGAMAAMRLFRHKTLHLKFKYGVPLILGRVGKLRQRALTAILPPELRQKKLDVA